MASHKSALKSIKQIRKRTEQNQVHTTRLRHQIRKFRAALKTKDKAGRAGASETDDGVDRPLDPQGYSSRQHRRTIQIAADACAERAGVTISRDRNIG